MNISSKDFLKKVCTPAKIYMIIAVIASILFLFKGVSIVAVFFKLFFAAIWTFILDWLCKKGYSSLSWFLVLLPYIIIALAAFELYHISEEHRHFLRQMQLQGPYGQEAFTNPNTQTGSAPTKQPTKKPPTRPTKK